MSRARRVVENAFGIAAQKWRILLKPLETHPSNTIKIIKAICCLHNFLLTELEWNKNPARNADHVDEENGSWREDGPIRALEPMNIYARNARRTADQMREKLKDYFCREGAVSWQEKMI